MPSGAQLARNVERASRASSSVPAPAALPVRLLEPLLLVLVVAAVWHRALDLFFSQDDFAQLARSMGIESRPPGAWRWLSVRVFWDVLRSLANLSPRPYHAASLLAHLGAVLALYAGLSRSVSRPAALAGSVFYAAHAALFAAIYWIAAIADPMATCFTLLAAFAWRSPGRTRWLTPLLFALAILSKESALPLPLALLAVEPSHEPRRFVRRLTDPVWLTLVAIAAAGGLAFISAGAMGAGGGSSSYALGGVADIVRNALTYLGWTLNPWLPTATGFSDAQDPSVFGWAGALIVLWLAGLTSAPLRRRGWFAAGVRTGAFLLPYLPLGHHTYHYYLALPLAGVAAMVAIALDAALAKNTIRALDGAIGLGLAALLALNGALLVRKIETAPFPIPGLYADAIVDRAHIAQRVFESLRTELPDTPVRLAVWPLPPPGTPPGGYAGKNLRSALYDGLALRVLFPQVREVQFLESHRQLDESWRWVLARPTGDARVLAPAALDSLIRRFGPPR